MIDKDGLDAKRPVDRDDIDSKKLPYDRSEPLANLTMAAGAMKTDVQPFRLEPVAPQTADKLKEVATKAANAQTISRAEAAEIKKTADTIKTAAANGDRDTAIEHAEKLQDRVDEIVMSQKPEVAQKLKKADDKEDMPAVNSQEDVKILRAAVAKVIEADPLVPPEKKQEATDFTTNMMKEGFQRAETTHGQLVDAVESRAATLNKTATDRQYYSDYSYGYGYPTSYYSPYYSYGYGYRQCLYYSSYPYCQGQLYGDYAYYNGFHNFYHGYGYGRGGYGRGGFGRGGGGRGGGGHSGGGHSGGRG